MVLPTELPKNDNDLTIIAQYKNADIDIEKAVNNTDKLSLNENSYHNAQNTLEKKHSGMIKNPFFPSQHNNK